MTTHKCRPCVRFRRATNRAINESTADPSAAIAANKVKVLEPILDEVVELEH